MTGGIGSSEAFGVPTIVQGGPSMDVRQIQMTLNVNGFPCGAVDGEMGIKTKGAVERFQKAFNNGQWLTVDGIPGPRTQAALVKLPYISAHFSVNEVRSKGNGDCYVMRDLLEAMEKVRDQFGVFVPLSVYRDPVHNKRVGGASNSMHVQGLAFDPGSLRVPVSAILDLDIFSGVGRRGGMFAHGDLRHLSPENSTPGATPDKPVQWVY